MRKFLLLLASCLLLTVSVLAADSTITSMKTDCRVETDGTCYVTQTLTLELQDLQSELDFPLGENVRRPEIAGYSAKKYTADNVTGLRLTSNTGITGARTFTITYELTGLVSQANDVQTFTLPLLCGRWEWPIEHYDFTVSMPKEFTASPGFESGYQGDAIEGYMTVSVRDTMISGSMKDSLKDRESLKMTLELPSGYFSGSHAKWSANWLATVFVLLLIVLALLYWARTLRSARLRASARMLPPDSVQPGDLPYLLCRGRPNFNMLVCYWASLGYLSIFVNEKGNVILRRRVEMGNERRRLECRLFGELFGDNDVCDGASLRYKRTAARAIEQTPRYWDRRLYEKSSGNIVLMQGLCALATSVAMLLSMSVILPVMSARGLVLFLFFLLGIPMSLLIQRAVHAIYLREVLWLALGGLSALAMVVLAGAGDALTMLLTLAMSVFTGWQTLHGGKRSELGNQLIGQTLGFRKYLSKASDSHTEMMLRRDGQYFYKLLPYAEALGLSAQFAARFGDTELEPCDWYGEANELPNQAGGFYSRWRETLALLDVSIRK